LTLLERLMSDSKIPSNPARRAGLLAATLAAANLAGCVIAPYPARGRYGAAPQDPVYEGPVVNAGPPRRQNESPGYPPVRGYLWIGGFRNWTGGRHAWVRGYWAPPRVGYAWAPHRWHRYGPGWRLAPGRWQRG